MNQCANEICRKPTKGKFCCRSCSATVTNRINRLKEPKICISCNSSFRRSEPGKRCNNCRNPQNKEAHFETITNNGTRRKYLVNERGWKCEGGCGLSTWLGSPIPLEVDHIDGNHGNTKKENFRLICPNCHVFTPTYKGKNGKRNYAPVVQR